MGCSRGEIGSQAWWRPPGTTREGSQITMKKLGLLLALAACVAVPMTLIRSADTAAAGHNARDQTPVTSPAQRQREPIILRPSNAKGPSHLPEFVPDKGFVNERTAHRRPARSSD